MRARLSPAPTPFVGRTGAVGEVRALLAGEWLVSLLGPGGIGKTRLAMRVAEVEQDRSDDRWPGGVWWCELVEARTLESLCVHLLHALGQEGGAPVVATEPLEAVVRRLRTLGASLVVLDNCEQMAEVVAEALSQLHDRAPETRWLVTSRERLRAHGEQTYEVPPLSLPLEGTAASEAVQLFVDRAARARSDYRPDREELTTIGELVRSLDGMPLAIELAAARVRVLSPASLLARMSSRLDLLCGAPRGAHARQATVRAAIQGSWDALLPEEQRALRRCAVFQGGFNLEAVENVVEVHSTGALSLIEALHDKSLLRVYASQAPLRRWRFGLYQTIRDFAFEQLVAAGELEATITRQWRWYAQWAYRQVELARYEALPEATAELAAEIHNLLLSHENALREADRDPAALDGALALATALWPILSRESLAVHSRPLDATLTHPAAARSDPALLAAAYRERAIVRLMQGRENSGLSDFETALAHASRSADALVECTILMQRVTTYGNAGRLAEARQGVLQAIGTFEESGRDALAANARRMLAHLELRAGNLDAAYAHCTRALDALRPGKQTSLLGYAFATLGVIEHLRGRRAQARAAYDQSLAALHSTRHMRAIAYGLRGMLWFEERQFEQSRADLEASTDIWRDVGAAPIRAGFLAVSAALAASQGAMDRARERLAEADAELLHAAGSPPATISVMRALAEVALARAESDAVSMARARANAEALLAADTLASADEELLVARRLLAACLTWSSAAVSEPAASSHAQRPIVFHAAGDWFELTDGRRIPCRQKRVLRGLLAALATAREQAPGRPVETETLIASGWPGLKIDRKTALHRLYTALNSLRDLGLRDVLLPAGRGYLLDPAVAVRLVDD